MMLNDNYANANTTYERNLCVSVEGIIVHWKWKKHMEGNFIDKGQGKGFLSLRKYKKITKCSKALSSTWLI